MYIYLFYCNYLATYNYSMNIFILIYIHLCKGLQRSFINDLKKPMFLMLIRHNELIYNSTYFALYRIIFNLFK